VEAEKVRGLYGGAHIQVRPKPQWDVDSLSL